MEKYRALSDTALAERLKVQDRMAYHEIYNRYWGLLFNHANRMLQDDQQAEDVVQDIFTVLWEKSVTIEFNSSLSAYLYSAVRNRVLKLFRREKVRQHFAFYLEGFDESACVTDQLIREKELREAIEKEIEKLPAKMRQVFELSRKAHFSYEEIATTVQISEGTVRNQIHNALKILRLKIGSLFFLSIMEAIVLIARLRH